MAVNFDVLVSKDHYTGTWVAVLVHNDPTLPSDCYTGSGTSAIIALKNMRYSAECSPFVGKHFVSGIHVWLNAMYDCEQIVFSNNDTCWYDGKAYVDPNGHSNGLAGNWAPLGNPYDPIVRMARIDNCSPWAQPYLGASAPAGITYRVTSIPSHPTKPVVISQTGLTDFEVISDKSSDPGQDLLDLVPF